MPRCRECNNTKSFGSSRVDPIAPFTNCQISGMVGNFSGNDEIISINSVGANKTIINDAADQPQAYFDICLSCGSQNVEWPNGSA